MVACEDGREAQRSMGDGVQGRAAGFGRPFLLPKEGLRIKDVLELVREGIPFDEIVQRYYPDLEVEDIKAWSTLLT